MNSTELSKNANHIEISNENGTSIKRNAWIGDNLRAAVFKAHGSWVAQFCDGDTPVGELRFDTRSDAETFARAKLRAL